MTTAGATVPASGSSERWLPLDSTRRKTEHQTKQGGMNAASMGVLFGKKNY